MQWNNYYNKRVLQQERSRSSIREGFWEDLMPGFSFEGWGSDEVDSAGRKMPINSRQSLCQLLEIKIIHTDPNFKTLVIFSRIYFIKGLKFGLKNESTLNFLKNEFTVHKKSHYYMILFTGDSKIGKTNLQWQKSKHWLPLRGSINWERAGRSLVGCGKCSFSRFYMVVTWVHI